MLGEGWSSGGWWDLSAGAAMLKGGDVGEQG
jgi:hypothetical protein